jgi:hypothetical protein
VLFNRIRLNEQYFALNEDEECHKQYENKMHTFMTHHLRPLSCGMNQLMARYTRERPLEYPPMRAQIIDDINAIPLQWPPQHTVNDASNAVS